MYEGKLKTSLKIPVNWIAAISWGLYGGGQDFCCRILSLRRKLCGSDCQPLVVVGPQALNRVLQTVNSLHPLAFRFIDNYETLADSALLQARLQ